MYSIPETPKVLFGIKLVQMLKKIGFHYQMNYCYVHVHRHFSCNKKISISYIICMPHCNMEKRTCPRAFYEYLASVYVETLWFVHQYTKCFFKGIFLFSIVQKSARSQIRISVLEVFEKTSWTKHTRSASMKTTFDTQKSNRGHEIEP